MKRLLFTAVFTAGCSAFAGTESTNVSDVDCAFQFGAEPVCSYKIGKYFIQVSLTMQRLADDERVLVRASVNSQGRQHTLSMSPDVSMMLGDIGIVSFADINFDDIPDIAISTSFGVANQYFDYWTYDPRSKSYVSIGNYPKLDPNPADQTLTATVKVDAVTYQQHKYSWDGGKLKQRR